MIKHIVMWKMKEENRADNMRRMKKIIDELQFQIPEIKKIEAGINISGSPRAYDLVLYSEFDSEVDLENYRTHPDHKKAVNFINRVTLEAKAVDYTI